MVKYLEDAINGLVLKMLELKLEQKKNGLDGRFNRISWQEEVLRANLHMRYFLIDIYKHICRECERERARGTKCKNRELQREDLK